MTAANSLDWLLDDMIGRLSGVRCSVVLSTDGLLLGRSAALARDDAERFCAMASAMHGLARGAGRHFQAGGVCQTVIELDHGVLFITAAGPNACLALLTDENADLGMAAYEVNRVVDRVGEHLSVSVRRT
ncbi:roadblock/LC7 domain-containing protein [Nocardia yamanashiensis]|uniref:roadblock/LC7 domain-containing protein n=1 Tax=Nocardia yamanashiensis TaxID=209247 RepID=UPI0008349BA1|nr:roadblock/LC7 domain-containing protein [Nocardia yamanashiensis]